MFMCDVISVPGDFLPSSAALSTTPCQELLWAILPMFFLLLLHLQGTTHALALCLSLPFQVCSRSELLYSLGLVFPSVLVCTRQSGLLQHQELALSSSPCMQYKCRPGMRALFMHHWPRSTAKQFFAAKKYACHWYVSYFENNPGLSHISSSFACDQYQSLFFKSQGTGAAWFIFLAFARLQGMLWSFKQNWRMH